MSWCAPLPRRCRRVHLNGVRASFADLLPPVNDLLTSRFEPHVRCGLKYLVLLLTSFGKIIKGWRGGMLSDVRHRHTHLMYPQRHVPTPRWSVQRGRIFSLRRGTRRRSPP